MRSVKLTLDSEHAWLIVQALRHLADLKDSEFEGHDQLSQLRWIATYIEHKARDARRTPEESDRWAEEYDDGPMSGEEWT